MTQQGGMPGFGGGRGAASAESNGYTSGTEKGSRRKKLAGDLKAANGMRQSYMGGGQFDGEEDIGIPGSYPELTAARSGEEEMILFPSYARRLYPKKTRHDELPGSKPDLMSSRGTVNSEDWKREWDRYEDGKSIVDVDVRGWIYSPHTGAMTRKQRFVVGIARRLSGVPAPSPTAESRASSPTSMVQNRLESHAARHEEEQIEREAISLARKGQGEADIAWRGEFSESSGRDSDRYSIQGSSSHSRATSPDKERAPRSFGSHDGSIYDDASSLNSLEKRPSWNQPQDMSPAEISVANAHLMARLKPFLHIPLINTPLTVFFYNENTTKSRSITTNESGHFSLRTPLDFIPTSVRVLASDRLSATEEVHVTEPHGISMISDIDDTIKHSGIGNGARDIFRNVFIRELGDLTIEGAKEWYTKMADRGVQLHYVSNAPWQLYPLLTSFFAMAGLPKGSFHLKQYNGMLQGIFEPVAERKKGTLEKIMQDFPERRFILVGDSGEADLELYTETVLANPGRVLGVFIRDVTTTRQQGFFDTSLKPLRNRGSQSPIRGRKKDSISISNRKSMSDLSQKPGLPPRPSMRSIHTNVQTQHTGPSMGQLIDYDDTPAQGIARSLTDPDTEKKSPPPPRPKPLSLRTVSRESLPLNPVNSTPTSNTTRKPIPPPKPRKYSTSESSNQNQPAEPSPLSQTETASSPGSRATSLERQSYRALAKNKVSSVYNSLPSWSSYAPVTEQQQGPTSAPRNTPADDLNRKGKLPPPIPPRRGLSSYPAAAAHYASNRLSGGLSGYNPEATNDDANGGAGGGGSGDGPEISKKEEMWKQRWARAKKTFAEKGVLLKSWRRGEDVMDDAVGLVERAKREENTVWKNGKGAGVGPGR